MSERETVEERSVSEFEAVVIANLLRDARGLEPGDGPWCRMAAVLPHLAAIAVAGGAVMHAGADGQPEFDTRDADLIAIDAAAAEIAENILPSLPVCRGVTCDAPSALCGAHSL